MADNPFANIGGQLVSKLFGSVLWIGLAIILMAVVGGLLYYFVYYKKKFDINVEVKSQRADGSFSYIEDRAAILYDRKDKSKFVRLFSQRVDLPLFPYDVLRKSNKGDLLKIWRKSENEWIYLKEGGVTKSYSVRQDGKVIPVAELQDIPVENDIGWWNIKRKDKNKSLFSVDSVWAKILPFLPQIVSGMIMIMMLYILMDKMPAVLSQLIEITRELNALKSAQVIG